eukprot:gene1432-2779_t
MENERRGPTDGDPFGSSSDSDGVRNAVDSLMKKDLDDVLDTYLGAWLANYPPLGIPHPQDRQ